MTVNDTAAGSPFEPGHAGSLEAFSPVQDSYHALKLLRGCAFRTAGLRVQRGHTRFAIGPL
jgi:hypothetical protein